MQDLKRQRPAVLYHYTTHERAKEVLADVDEPGVYAEVSDGLYGPGFYALDLAPESLDRDVLRWECYEDSRSTHPMDGVLAIETTLSVPSFTYQYRHIWLLPIDPRSEGPPSIGHMIGSVGVYREGEGWRWIDLY
jgi:hypothetical protein